MRKHTPGPWRHRSKILPEYIGTDDLLVAITWPSPDTEEGMANAALVAAAPELLDALTECLVALGRMGDDLVGGLNHPAWVKAIAALAKAEGRK